MFNPWTVRTTNFIYAIVSSGAVSSGLLANSDLRSCLAWLSVYSFEIQFTLPHLELTEAPIRAATRNLYDDPHFSSLPVAN